MIYTIGTVRYEKSLKELGKVHKLGRTRVGDKLPNGDIATKEFLDDKDFYTGGYAFKTKEDAQDRIDNIYSNTDFIVWGLDATWDDVDQVSNEKYGYLLFHREIIDIRST